MNSNNSKKSKKVITISTKLFSIFIDVVFVLLFTYLLSTFISDPIISMVPSLREARQTQITILEDTHLAKHDVKTNQYYLYSTNEYFEKEENGHSKIINILNYYYVDYLKSSQSEVNEFIYEIGKYDYLVLTDSDIPDLNAKYINEKGEVDVAAINFVGYKYQVAVNSYYQLPKYKSCAQTLAKGRKTISLVLNEIGVVIFFIIVPLIKLKGNTCGMKIIRLKVISSNGGPLKWYQILTRYIIFLTFPVYFYFASGFLTFIYPLVFIIGDIIYMSLSQNTRSLLDKFGNCLTISNEKNNKLSFNNIEK